jgi:hypothetical protein
LLRKFLMWRKFVRVDTCSSSNGSRSKNSAICLMVAGTFWIHRIYAIIIIMFIVGTLEQNKIWSASGKWCCASAR